jgi:hypothetical protein
MLGVCFELSAGSSYYTGRMAKITTIPDAVTGAGQNFDYTNPFRLASLVLVNAPLDPDHLNIGLNKAAYDAFIDAEIVAGRAWQADDLNVQDPEHDLILPIEYEEAVRYYNYGRLTIGGRAWYIFYTPIYKNKTSTVFVADIDEFPSYEWSLGYSQIERGHVAVAASAGGNIGYCLEPEPISIGDLIGYASYQHDPLGTARVLVVSATDLRAYPWRTVDPDTGDTASDLISTVQTSGTIEAPQPVGDPATFPYSYGNSGYDDEFYYPYAASAGLSPGNTMYRPYVTGATPSLIDGVAAEGGAFLYSSIGAYLTHMSYLAHVPWIANGISRAILVPGGSGGGSSAIPLTPWDEVEDIPGAPSYQASFTTAIGYDTTLAADWRAGLPAAYTTWTKLRTGPFSAIEIADRQGSATDFDPQTIPGLGALTLHVEGAFYPEADVAAWIAGAGGTAAPGSPLNIPLATDLPHFEVGRDAAYASGAASIAAERSQSIFDMLQTMQRAQVDNAFTLSSAFTAAQYAIAEGV